VIPGLAPGNSFLPVSWRMRPEGQAATLLLGTLLKVPLKTKPLKAVV